MSLRSGAAAALALLLASAVPRSAGGQETVPATRPATASAPVRRLFWFTAYPDLVQAFDTANETVVATIRLRHGHSYGMDLAHDRRRFIVTTRRQEGFEIVDIASRAVTEDHDLTTKDRIRRIRRVIELPGGRLLLEVNVVKREKDRYIIEKRRWLLYDLASRSVVREMERLPAALDRGSARISPDGKAIHVFGKDLVIVDPATFEETGRIELSRPIHPGYGALRLRSEDDLLDFRDAGAYRMFYTMQDPVEKRRTLFGIADVDVAGRRIRNLDEHGIPLPGWGYVLSPDKRRLYALEEKLVSYDVERKRKLAERELRLRPRRWLAGVSGDGRRIFIGGAGHDLAVYDVDTLEWRRDVLLPNDMAGRMHILDEDG